MKFLTSVGGLQCDLSLPNNRTRDNFTFDDLNIHELDWPFCLQCALARPFSKVSLISTSWLRQQRLKSLPKRTIVGDTSAPLADYFFISGIESSQVYDERLVTSPTPAPVEDTIEEDEALVTNHDNRPDTPTSPTSPADTIKRRSRYSFEARKSIGSIINLNGEAHTPASNRSSTTIKAGKVVGGSGLSDDAFEEALKKFASERDSFLEDIHMTAGAVITPPHAQTQKKPRPKTVRITQDEDSLGVGLRGPVGSIQRRALYHEEYEEAAFCHESTVFSTNVEEAQRL